MYKFIFRRSIYVIPTLVGVSVVIFVLFNLVSGDPTAVILGKYATPKQMADLRHELGLDKSLFFQYLDVLKSMFTFNFGRSWKSNQLISDLLFHSGLNSLTVSVPILFFSTLFAISVAMGVSLIRGSKLDRAVMILAVIMMSIPGLVYILIGQWLLAFKMGIFEICGYDKGFPNFIPYILLPTLIGVLLSFGRDFRYFRSLVLEEINQEYVRTARAKGLPRTFVLFKHVLRNAMIPITANLIYQLPDLVMGWLLLENFFGIPGFGNIVLQSIFNSDFPIIKASTIIMAVLSIFFNLIADIVYKILDPRIRLN